MKYFTWKMDWSSGVGIDPTSYVNTETVRIEPVFSIGATTEPDTVFYAYLTQGDIDTKELGQWNVKEITAEAMLSAAQLLAPAATLSDGIIVFPIPTKFNIGETNGNI